MQSHLLIVKRNPYLRCMTDFRPFTQEGRITSVHGVLLPPKKKLIVDRYVTVRFVITGTIPSKKNMIWAATNLFKLLRKLYAFDVVKDCVDWLRSNLKAFIRNSEKYKQWVDTQTPIILEQAAAEASRYAVKHGLTFPLDNVTISVYHYWADNVARDNSNKYDSIIDLLVACQILMDDRWQVVHENRSASECYYGDIRDHITTIDITQRFLPATHGQRQEVRPFDPADGE